MRPINILIPAAGDSERFRAAGIFVPKPLIKFNRMARRLPGILDFRKTMLEHARGDLPADWPTWVGVQPRDVRAFRLGLNYKWNLVPVYESRGQAESILQMLPGVPDGDVLIINCDQGFTDGILANFVERARHAQICERHMSCAALVFNSQDPRYGYVDAEPWFSHTAEKVAISPWAVAGAFWFQDVRILAQTIQEQLHYDAPNYITETMRRIKPDRGKLAVKIETYQLETWGTPEELYVAGVEELDPGIETAIKDYVEAL